MRNFFITNRHEHWTANLAIILPEWTGLRNYYKELINKIRTNMHPFFFAHGSPSFELAQLLLLACWYTTVRTKCVFSCVKLTRIKRNAIPLFFVVRHHQFLIYE